MNKLRLKMTHFKILLSILAIIILHEITFSNAYAYLDPGSASIFIQLIIGALFGVSITIKIYWVKIKQKISTKFSRN